MNLFSSSFYSLALYSNIHEPYIIIAILSFDVSTIDDCAKDGGEEFFTEMHCVLWSNSYGIVKGL